LILKYRTSLYRRMKPLMGPQTGLEVAFKEVPGADFAVGLEGGLNKANGTSYFLVCGAAIVDSNQKTYIGLGGQLELPKEVSIRVKNNERFGEVIREYKAKNKTDQKCKPLNRFSHFKRRAVHSSYK